METSKPLCDICRRIKWQCFEDLLIYTQPVCIFCFFLVYLKSSSQFIILEVFSLLIFVPFSLYALLFIFRVGIQSSPGHRKACDSLKIPISKPRLKGTGVSHFQ